MKNEKGFAPIIIAIAAVIAVGAVGFFMMNRGGGGKNKLPEIKIPGAAGLGLNANCKLNDPELCRYMDKTVKTADSYAKGFVGTSTTTDKAGKKSENIWEIAGDRSHFATFEGGKEISNMITIADSTYTKDMSDGKWLKFTFQAEKGKKNLFSVSPEEIKKEFQNAVSETEDKTVYKPMGKEACGSLTCFKYEIVNALTPETKEYLYFDDKEYIMRKMRVEDETGTVTETMFEFKTVDIKEPLPIKTNPTSDKTLFPGTLEKLPEGVSSIDSKQMQQDAQKFIEQMGKQETLEGEVEEPAGE